MGRWGPRAVRPSGRVGAVPAGVAGTDASPIGRRARECGSIFLLLLLNLSRDSPLRLESNNYFFLLETIDSLDIPFDRVEGK